MSENFDWKAPTVQMLGRWQPWHKGHTELFLRAYSKTGQVLIMCRDVFNSDEMPEGQDDNPFGFKDVSDGIEEGLSKEGFTKGEEYDIILVPNIVDISYGRGVGYTFTEHDLGKDIHSISATNIRNEMRKEGKLANKS